MAAPLAVLAVGVTMRRRHALDRQRDARRGEPGCARRQSQRAGLLGWPQDGERLAVPGVAPRLLEAIDVVRVAIAHARELTGPADPEGDRHDRVRNPTTSAVHDLDEQMSEVVAAGGERGYVGGEANPGGLAGSDESLAADLAAVLAGDRGQLAR